jgi:hypothetical protein
VIVAALVQVGEQWSVVWEFGAGVLAVYLVAAMFTSGIEAIRRFLGGN